MKTKYLFMAAIGALTLVSCADESFVGDQEALNAAGERPIGFNLSTAYATRADKTGSAAATDLGDRFIVYGEKGSITNAAPTAGNLVFPNYQVNYGANTAYTTTSNTKDWEYVGYTHSANYQGNITMDPTSSADDEISASDVAQTIKYWDYSAENYIFTAVSAADADIEAGRVKIQKNQYGTTAYDKGYTIKLAKTGDSEPYTYPNLTKLFFADRKVIAQGTGSDRTAVNAYGGNVTLTFRNLLSHVRVGMFETIPGYSVKITKFYYKNNGTPANFAAMKSSGESTTAFVANASNLGTSNEATLTVTYQSSGSTENQPTVAVSDATAATHLTLGTNIPGTALGETAPAARFDQAAADTYTPFFPQETNSVPLKLMVDYTLTAPVTNETINVYGATAEVPAEYLQWKPNYKYTYLFKITDNTDGKTKLPDGVNPDSPEGLYPITFDAVEVIAEDGKAEYITTVSEPSITTFGVKDSKYSVGQNEYAAGTVVYATVMDNSSLATLSASNMKLYTVTGTGDLTEAGVAEALIEKPTMTAAQVALAKVIPAASSFTGYQKTVPAEDGTTKTLHESDAKAAYFTTATGTKYAIVFENTAATYICGTAVTTTDASDYATKAAAAPGNKLYTTAACSAEATAGAGTFYAANGKTYADAAAFAAAGLLYKDAACTEVATSTYYDEHTSDIYYKPIKVDNKGVYTVKVVNCP